MSDQAVALELWFDEPGDEEIRAVWAALEVRGVTTLATTTHRQHAPHVSLTVGNHLLLDDPDVSAQLRAVPRAELTLGGLGLFPGGVAFSS